MLAPSEPCWNGGGIWVSLVWQFPPQVNSSICEMWEVWDLHPESDLCHINSCKWRKRGSAKLQTSNVWRLQIPGTLCCFGVGFAGTELICCHFYFRNVMMWRSEALSGFHSFLLMNYHSWTKLGFFWLCSVFLWKAPVYPYSVRLGVGVYLYPSLQHTVPCWRAVTTAATCCN